MPSENLVASVSDVLNAAADEGLASFITEHASEKPTTDPAPTPIVDPAAQPQEKPEGAEKTTEQPKTDTEPPAPPEGMTAVPVLSEGLVTELVVRDAAGEEIEIPALVIEYKANGKIRKDRIDHVVRLAQSGVYQQEREQRMAEREAALAESQQPLVERIRLREEQLEQLLQNEELYQSARERYLENSAPEKQVARLREELKEKDALVARAELSAAATKFATEEIGPALTTIAEALPEVTLDELENQLAVAMFPMMQDGVVPPSRYGDIRNFIISNLTEWAKRTHHTRTQRFSTAKEKAEQELRKSREESQAAKNALARAAKPVVRSAPANAAPSKARKQHLHIDDAIEDATNEGLRNMGLL